MTTHAVHYTQTSFVIDCCAGTSSFLLALSGLRAHHTDTSLARLAAAAVSRMVNWSGLGGGAISSGIALHSGGGVIGSCDGDDTIGVTGSNGGYCRGG